MTMHLSLPKKDRAVLRYIAVVVTIVLVLMILQLACTGSL